MGYTLTKEKEMHRQIEELMREWKEAVVKQSSKEMADEYASENGNMAELFVTDGFYPYYTGQKKRILFIGREALQIMGSDYIEKVGDDIMNNGEVGKKSVNSNKFHALMMYVAYGILNGYPKYGSIPWATEIAEKFAREGGISYAFMNISKLSNENKDWKADKRLMRYFLDTNGNKDFFAKELRILNPDVIIGMNLVNEYSQDMGEFRDKKPFGSTGQVDAYTLQTNDAHNYLFLDSYHFAHPGKKWEDDYYIPIIDACKELLP